MFAVEVYAAVRHFVFVEGNSRREAARIFGLSRETVLKMCRFSLPPGYTRTKPVAKPKLGPLLPVIDAILEADRTGAGEAAAYGEADIRAAARRAWVRRRLHGGEGLCADRSGARARDVRAAVASTRPCAGGFWRSGRRDRRGSLQDPLLLHGPAAVGCLLCEGLSGRDDGGLPGRACVGLRLLRRRAAVGALRQSQDRGGEDLRRRQTGADAGVHGTGQPLSVPATGSGGPARGTTKARSRGW